MDTRRWGALITAASMLGGCVVAPPMARPTAGAVYVEQGADGQPSYIAQDIATLSGEPAIVTGPDVRVVPGWTTYGGYGYAPYAYPPLPASSLYFTWRSAPVWRPYPYAYPGRPSAARPYPRPHAVAPVPRAAPPAAVAPRPTAPPPGYRGPYRGLMGARK